MIKGMVIPFGWPNDVVFEVLFIPMKHCIATIIPIKKGNNEGK